MPPMRRPPLAGANQSDDVIDGARAERGVARAASPQALDAGILGGHVDVERGVVVGDDLPDLHDAGAFGV